MSQLDDLLGGLLGGQGGGGGGLEDILGQLTGGGQDGRQAGAGGAGMLAMLVPLVAGFLKNGGLNKILSGLQQQGLGSEAQSWIGTGDNAPVSGAQLEQAIGHDQIAEIARQLGISESQAADAVAEVLPRVVDGVSPEGELPAEPDLDALFARISGAGR